MNMHESLRCRNLVDANFACILSLSEKAAERRNVYRTATRNLLPSSVWSDMFVLLPIEIVKDASDNVIPLFSIGLGDSVSLW